MSCQLCCPKCGSFLEIAAKVKSSPPERNIPPEQKRVCLNRYKLTPRTREAAEHLLEGMRNQDIADAMGIKLQVVKNYLKDLYDQVGCGSRTEFIAMVLTGRRG